MSRRIKGEGTIRRRTDGRWEGRYVNCIGETKSIYGQSKADVKRKLQEITYTTDTNVFNNIKGDIKLDIWFEHYLEIKKRMVKARSLYQIQSAYKKHIGPFLGGRIVSTITPIDIANFITHLENKNLSTTTVDNIITHARTMFKFAADERAISVSPFLYVKNNLYPKKVRRNLTSLEIEHILEVTKSLDYTMYLMLCIMLYTGIRAGELCGLRWNDFDADFTYLRVDESRTDNIFENTTKTESSNRIIPLMGFLQSELKELRNYKNPDINDYVFINRLKRPYNTENIDKKFRYIRSCVMSIYPEHDLHDITPHCFRHTFTTNGIISGVSIKNMQMLLGHANTHTLLDTYMHVNYDDKKTAIEIIEKNSHIIHQSSNENSDANNPENTLINKWAKVKHFKSVENYNQELKYRIV